MHSECHIVTYEVMNKGTLIKYALSYINP